ncbi:MAG: glycosyltransferase [Ilumatobacteraceae bacterium]|nr:glycosyltransferase [Ilumatobacteraceae bacterium]
MTEFSDIAPDASAETEPVLAPPVVAVVVVHELADCTAECLDALGSQDYPNLQILVLSTSSETHEAATATLDMVANNAPKSVLRFMGANPGFGAACNNVLVMVDGESGFYLFIHDDAALATDAVSRLIEELYRSNAGIVGPKVVSWNDARQLESVGIAVDRFGERDSVVDAGEIDQEQHDAVRDTFVLPSTCMLIRADLFRALGGFEPSLSSESADLDLCWRAHTTGARVVVVPAAVVKHLHRSIDSNSPEQIRMLVSNAEKERIHTTLALTQAAYLPLVILQLLVISIAQLVVGVFSGSPSRAWGSVRSLVTSPFHLSALRARRKRVLHSRVVDDREIHALQSRGSARFSAYLRKRARVTGKAEAENSASVGDVAVRQRGTVAFWLTLFILTLIGSRSLLVSGVTRVGQFVPFIGNGREMMSLYSSGWWPGAFGKAVSAPTGMSLSAFAAAVSFGRVGLLQTLAVVALPFIGYIGAWQFASVYATRRARIITALTYAAVPLPYACISIGRWGGLLVYAAFPWFAHIARLLVAHRPVVASSREDAMDYFMHRDQRVFTKRVATLTLILAVVTAFEVAVLIVVAELVIVWFLVTWIHGARLRDALMWPLMFAMAGLGALVLHAPWLEWFATTAWWSRVSRAPIEGGRNIGLLGLASFDIGILPITRVAVLLFIPAFASIFIVRGSRAPWALRGSLLAAAALLVALLDDRAILPIHFAEPAIMLVPVAFGLSVAVGALGASMTVDVRHAKFGWRQPLSALASLAFVIGMLPSTLSFIDGRWNQTTTSVMDLLEQLPAESEAGSYRTIFLGDARTLPGAPISIGWGVAYSVITGAHISTVDLWEPPRSRATDEMAQAVRGIVRGNTARAGRLIAPLAVRFIVVPIIDQAASTRSRQLPVPQGLIAALGDQLDLRRRYSSPDLVIFENSAWVPVRSTLSTIGAEASKLAGAASTIAADLAGATPVLSSTRPDFGASAKLEEGTLHLAVPFSPRWKLKVDARPITSRTAFGTTTAFDVPSAGNAKLSYSTSIVRLLAILAEAGFWAATVFLMLVRSRKKEKNSTAQIQTQFDSPVLSFGADSK